MVKPTLELSSCQIIDLTHTLDENTPSWSGECGFQHTITSDYADGNGEVKFRIQKITMHAGIGTHLDAPVHCIPNGLTVDQLSLRDLVAPGVVIDVSPSAHERYSVSPQDIKAFEDTHGRIAPRSLVIIRTGWERFWGEPKKYRNQLVFPAVSIEAAQLLLEREIVGLGIDTLSSDRADSGFPVHRAVLGAGKYLIENVANADQLPPVGSLILALPLKTRHGTEAPIRLIGLIHMRSVHTSSQGRLASRL